MEERLYVRINVYTLGISVYIYLHTHTIIHTDSPHTDYFLNITDKKLLKIANMFYM